ncbi:MAG TPA: V-type ATP synthase subunit D [Polyangia bacterium]
MARLQVSPTKSSLLALARQLAFAEEGYELLEQKRQLLVFELMSRLGRARAAERRVGAALPAAFAALREAHLDVGAAALAGAADAVRLDHEVDLGVQRLMGLRLARVTARIAPADVQFGVSGTSANVDAAMLRFVALLPDLAELAELQTAVIQLARELRKTQRRCNALSKLFIPDYRETIAFITAALEERERESFTIFKLIRDRLRAARETEEPPCAR